MVGYFRNSIILLYGSTLILTFVLILGVHLNAHHYELLFNTISYLIIIVGLIKFPVVNSACFSAEDNILIGILLIWFIVCILRSISIPFSNFTTIPRFLGGKLYSAALLAPFFVYWGGNLKILISLWQFSKILIVIFLVLSPSLFIFDRNYLWHLTYILPLFLLNKDKLEKEYVIYTYLAVGVAMLFFVITSERNQFVKLFYYLVIISIFRIDNNLTSIANISIKIAGIISVSIIFCCFMYIYSGRLSKHFSDPRIVENIKSYEKDNLNSDTRIMVFEDFVLDFAKWPDLLFGRGALGTTYSPRFITLQELYNEDENVFRFPYGHRLEVESGYLQIILKTGLIGLIPLMIIGIRAMFLGFFRTKNNLTIICAFIILERFVLMYPFGLPSYSIDYILFWLCIGACLSQRVRTMTNNSIYLSFKMKEFYQVILFSKSYKKNQHTSHV
ncbi:hypothetical protein [uncultured Draconibacterium sp.]|uniref:hypothetical protein n=1 Tax=uncultured Draconibacterium sp. TaxID=1573823 RepID=UPI002AA6B5B3|nr:hypothetical protein [uncultured Draconibacterium sp.]